MVNEADRDKCKQALKIDTYMTNPGDKMIIPFTNPIATIDLNRYTGKNLMNGSYTFMFGKREVGNGVCAVELQFSEYQATWDGYTENSGNAVLVGQEGVSGKQSDGRWVGESFSLGLSDGTLIQTSD